MSKKKVKERIEMYSQISRMKEVKFFEFSVLYHKKEKIWFLYLDYQNIDKEVDTKKEVTYQIKEMECFDGKGWLKISQDFKEEDFKNVFYECEKSKFNIKGIKIYPRNILKIA